MELRKETSLRASEYLYIEERERHNGSIAWKSFLLRAIIATRAVVAVFRAAGDLRRILKEGI